MRTAYMLALWTGQREGDVLRLPRARYDGAGLTIRQGRPEARRGKGRKGPVITLYVPAAEPLRIGETSAEYTFAFGGVERSLDALYETWSAPLRGLAGSRVPRTAWRRSCSARRFRTA